ncbi:PREDICTED: mitochondrial cardiolipin hydrolase [Dinoponera quadriceps]|uniref:Mitochondrial cardiolipin hydrolase n=1 Tax=Dinoponera quadriceps TaxID=609295 RepID=A0A6P3X3C4_DINQU|nr:PREDICTED: mitochondrial cardiolipin hydrolase [Dinoponera quadriceps]
MLTVTVICFGNTKIHQDLDRIVQCPTHKDILCNSTNELVIKKPSEEKTSINETSASEPVISESSENESTEKETSEKKPKLYDVMFFSERSQRCRYHLKTLKSCGKPDCSVGYLRKIIDLLGSATHTLDVCIFSLTCQFLREAIFAARERGVGVRFITNDSTMTNAGTTVLKYFLEDIRIQCRDSPIYLMHHKFCVIDNRILITGSANWTLSAFFGNCENIIITDDSEIVQKFQDEFTKLWCHFEQRS